MAAALCSEDVISDWCQAGEQQLRLQPTFCSSFRRAGGGEERERRYKGKVRQWEGGRGGERAKGREGKKGKPKCERKGNKNSMGQVRGKQRKNLRMS